MRKPVTFTYRCRRNGAWPCEKWFRRNLLKQIERQGEAPWPLWAVELTVEGFLGRSSCRMRVGESVNFAVEFPHIQIGGHRYALETLPALSDTVDVTDAPSCNPELEEEA